MGQFITIFIACMAFLILQAAPDHFTVATNSEFPPFSYLENGEIVGFDIDVAREVAHRLGKKIQFKDMPFDALIPELALGRVDFAAAGMSATEERAKRVFFTDSYLNDDPLVIFSSNPKELTLADIKEKIVVVAEGFTADTLMTAQGHPNLIRLPTQADAFMALKSGRADVFVTASTTVNQFLETQKMGSYKTTVIPGTSETCALVVPKSKPEILDQLQTTLEAMKEDGTLQKIKGKWKL